MGRRKPGLWALVGGIVGAAAVLAWSRRARARSFVMEGADENDLDALTRMLIAETDFSRDEDEMAQIIWVAVNRAVLYNKSPAAIVDPSGRNPTWNVGAAYRTRFEGADSHARWEAARAFVENVLAGAYQNLGATKFVHPEAMGSPPCGAGRIVVETSWGPKCLPEWIADGTEVGGALFA